MKIALWVLSVLFGGLSLIASIAQMRTEKKANPAMIMALGAAALIAAVICDVCAQGMDVWLALAGCAAICYAAIWNGLRGGQLHIQHHIIRGLVSLALIVGFALL